MSVRAASSSFRLLTPLAAAACGAVLCLPTAAPAGFIAYEGFNYPVTNLPRGTPLNGQNGGTGFSGPWSVLPGSPTPPTNYVINTTGSLSYPGLSTSGNQASIEQSSQINGLRRSFSQDLNGQVYYLSALIRPLGTVATAQFFGLALDSLGGTDVFVGKPGNANQWSLENVGGTGQSRSNYTAVSGQTDLLVLKMDLTSGLDEFTLWVNPILGPTDPPSFSAFKGDVNVGELDGLVLYSTGAFAIDEIRLGTSFAEVTPAAVPEPSSLALLSLCGLCGAGAAWRRRRKALAAVCPGAELPG